jgi:hypothetical protein
MKKVLTKIDCFLKGEIEMSVEKDSDDDDEGCGHEPHEDCMFCTECGKCRESLDNNDVCSECLIRS